LGTLRSLVIKPSTIVRYEKAFRLFLAFLLSQKVALAHNLLVLDDQVQCYLENLWEDGESLSLAGDPVLPAIFPAFLQAQSTWVLEIIENMAGARASV
jgi:hypothetical protein